MATEGYDAGVMVRWSQSGGDFRIGILLAKNHALTLGNVSNICPGGGWLDVAGQPGCMISHKDPPFPD